MDLKNPKQTVYECFGILETEPLFNSLISLFLLGELNTTPNLFLNCFNVF
jgi:hypothetical protein